MTFLEQQQDFANKAQDTSNTYFALAFVKTLLNQAFHDLAREGGGLKRFVQFVRNPEAIPPIGAGTANAFNYLGEYVPQGDFVMDELRELWLDATLPLEIVTARQAYMMLANWNDVTDDTPILAVPHEVKRGVVFISPQPATALTTLFGTITYQHPTLTNDGDVCEFPAPFHDLPVHRALELAYGADSGDTQDFQKAAFWGSQYREGKTRYLAMVGRNFAQQPARQRPGFY